ncbi:Diguanylate cyclase/phosphodiesterase domain 1 (ggdef) [Shigella dysenteriae 1617]|uniref:Diguanylate cyclase/phosphodiesterase domain 1 (Ggdef) n=1 Tax=Shigella dysenteriae 1617 TaxID=754093 RepID=A0A0A6ZXJ9_SHIDY|nr:Diguanylate cyclase/phosphodiesterase domain 1 (ggdef) [Shigella dysenteriae 1617]
MMLIWLLLSVTSVLTLKQYAQKNLGTDSSNNDLQSGSSCRFCRWPSSN